MSSEAETTAAPVVPDIKTAETGTTETTEPDRSEIEALLASQGLSDVSEDELHGEEVPEEVPEEPAESKKSEKPVESKESEKTGEADLKTEEEKEGTPPPKAEAPPKGFVPTAAIREAREENRQLKERIKALEMAVEAVKAGKSEPPALPKDEFKVLSKEEFEELSEESPREALVYMMRLTEYKEAQRETAQKQAEQQRKEQEVELMLRESAKQMAEAIPGIFDEDAPIRQELVDYAESIGFTKDMFYLTNPETLVILPGETEPVYLGSQAASMLMMLAEARKRSTAKPIDEEALRKQIEQDVLKKIKAKGASTFTSLDDIPTSETATPAPRGPLTEAQFARLSAAEQKAYLSGI